MDAKTGPILLVDLVKRSLREAAERDECLTATTIARMWGEEPIRVWGTLALLARRGVVEFHPSRRPHECPRDAADRQHFRLSR